MRNRKFVKPLLIVVAMILLCVMSVLATIAYLTAGDTITNTFTVGNIEIDLNETKVDEYGNPLYKTDDNGNIMEDENGDPIPVPPDGEGNEYKLVPNHTYTKDPTITVLKDSEACYLRAIITVTKGAALKAIGYTADTDKEVDAGNTVDTENVTEAFEFVWGDDWSVYSCKYVEDDETTTDKDESTFVFEVRYGKKVEYNANANQTFTVFKTFTTDDLTNAQLATIEGMEIIVKTEAIQADTFIEENGKSAMDNAFAALDGRSPNV